MNAQNKHQIGTKTSTCKKRLLHRARTGWLIAACLLLLLGGLGRAAAATYVCGVASGKWTKANSPYILTCDVLAVDIIIDPGVTVCASNYTFEVAGILTAIGTSNEPIVFNACNPAVGWQGIFFNYSSPGSELHYCVISNAVNSGVRITQSLPYFEHCTIANNTSASGHGGAIYALPSPGDLILSSCVLSNNTSASGYGGAIYANMSGNLILRSCVVANNTARYSGGGICVGMSTNTLILECCEIVGNNANPSAYGGTYVGGGS